MPYTPQSIRSTLPTLILGGRIELHPQVSSTNDLAREAGRRGEPEGLVVLAEEQVAGRGRMGRIWTAPPGCCILCSVLLRPRFTPQHAFYLTIAASLAIHRACATLLHRDEGLTANDQPSHRPSSIVHRPSIKWPNDVLIHGKKVAGVLCESEFGSGGWDFSVVGFGINVNLRPLELGELQATATSLSAELGRSLDRTALLLQVLAELEGLYISLQNGQFRHLHSEWTAALETIGRRVSVQEPGGTVSGVALRVDPDGALVVRQDKGTERRVLAGDVVDSEGH
jgi:BirA family biotin operon repressor/biotin-[acetyl-CoA-carboxylase] ligase